MPVPTNNTGTIIPGSGLIILPDGNFYNPNRIIPDKKVIIFNKGGYVVWQTF